MATIQYKIQLDETVVERLDEIAKKYGERSGNSVASSVVTDYLAFYVAKKEAELAVYNRQLEMLNDSTSPGKDSASKTPRGKIA